MIIVYKEEKKIIVLEIHTYIYKLFTVYSMHENELKLQYLVLTETLTFSQQEKSEFANK